MNKTTIFVFFLALVAIGLSITFVEEHKTKIIIGGVCLILGLIIGFGLGYSSGKARANKIHQKKEERELKRQNKIQRKSQNRIRKPKNNA